MGNAGEVQDFPFLKNDLQTPLPTMGKPLDPADGPGKADAELGTEYREDDRSTIHPYPADARHRLWGKSPGVGEVKP